MKPRRYLTIMVHRDGELESRTWRIPLGTVRAAGIAATVAGGLLLLGLAVYAPVVRAAARVPFLTRTIDRLEAENEQVRELAGRLMEMEARYAQVRRMLGGNIVPPGPVSPDELPRAHVILAGIPTRVPVTPGPAAPRRWPLDEPGVITRGQLPQDAGRETHPGIDIAIPTGTPIRASGGGTVSRTGHDAEYGLFVLVSHPEGYETMYGHASRLIVSAGDEVNTGQVIALSGSTGRSTAPHLHFEIRRGGRSIDPRSLTLEES